MKETRKLVAIMFTDIVGYTAMMGADESLAVKTVTHHKGVIEKNVKKYSGELIQFYGDGSLSIYASTTNAMNCAIGIQNACKKDIDVPLRVGIHIGEVLMKDGSIYGDGVNLASRIESLGQTGTILFSKDVYKTISNSKIFKSHHLGEFEFKNVDKAMGVYALANEGFPIPEKESISGKLKSTSALENFKSLKNSGKGRDEVPNLCKSKISQNSIAVLPFVNMSSDPEQEFFCEGIAEEIINTIVQIPDLIVAGRTSSFCFKGKNEDLRSVGSTLCVSKILEGSVRKSGDRIRITVQLIEAAEGFNIWSKKYDRKLDDVFQIQDDISAEIAKQLKITFEGSQSKPIVRHQTKNIDAYQLYFKGRSLFYQRGMSLYEAIDCFRLALAIDPEYALAYSGLADAFVMLSFHGYMSPADCWAEAIPAAQKALEYGEGLGETHNALAVIALLHDRDFEKAEQEFKKALEINETHIQARAWYGMFCLAFMEGDFEGAYKQFKIATEYDPLSSYIHSCYALTLATGEKLEKSLPLAEYAVELDPDSLIARYNLGYCNLWSGNLDEALKQCKIALKISSRHAWALHLILLILLKMDRKDEALRIYNEMKVRYRDHYLPPTNLAIAAAALGENEFALKLLQESIDSIDPYLPFILNFLKDSGDLRNIPEYDGIMDQLQNLTHAKKVS